jgi:hypothetical protein
LRIPNQPFGAAGGKKRRDPAVDAPYATPLNDMTPFAATPRRRPYSVLTIGPATNSAEAEAAGLHLAAMPSSAAHVANVKRRRSEKYLLVILGCPSHIVAEISDVRYNCTTVQYYNTALATVNDSPSRYATVVISNSCPIHQQLMSSPVALAPMLPIFQAARNTPPESVARSQLDGDFSTTNSLAGKSREAVADGVAEHTIQGGARQAIRRSFRV